MTAVLVGVLAAVTVLLTGRAPRWAPPAPTVLPVAAPPATGRGRWWRPVVALALGWVVVGGGAGLVVGCLVAAVVHRAASRAEPVQRRREREAVRRDLPLLVLLLASSLRSGAATGPAVRQSATALPGPAADRLVSVADRIDLGTDPGQVWDDLARDPELGPLGRSLARATRTGAPVAAVVERLSDDLAAAGRAAVEQRARAVGVRAALPLGVCLLPSFLLLGIVPLVASLVSGIQL